jgi:epoxyqueuosine reductase
MSLEILKSIEDGTMDSVMENLTTEFNKFNARFRTVSIIHLEELRDELHQWRQDGIIGKKFYEQNYGFFKFERPTLPGEPKSIIIIAIPQGIIPLSWQYHGKTRQVVLPPTYRFTNDRARCLELLSRVLQKEGCSAVRAILPFKLLATRSGLARYGRNNISYVDGCGSFVRLEAFYTDYVFPNDAWQEKQPLERCASCRLCMNACPTHCIPSDRFLIHADQCLTYFNEFEDPFPLWVKPYSHNALVGCLRCQEVCPENRMVGHPREEGIAFSETETDVILRGVPKDQLSPSLLAKLEGLNIDEYLPVLPRNLAVLLKKK